jgi:hypothetical protein
VTPTTTVEQPAPAPVGAIVGGVVGGFAVIAALAAFTWCMIKRNHSPVKFNNNHQSEGMGTVIGSYSERNSQTLGAPESWEWKWIRKSASSSHYA